MTMSEREPAVLRDLSPAAPPPPPPHALRTRTPVSVPIVVRRETKVVTVVGFWTRVLAAMIDLAIVVPAAVLVTFVVSKLAGVHLPPKTLRVVDVDLWIDLALARDPALLTGIVLVTAIGIIYLLLCHVAIARTFGMRALKIKVIDIYGEPPSPGRCVLRCAGYLASAATLFLGFLWIGFDSEKRGLQDWIAGTYVIRA
jgi:uncharacterized RDD family membrane protein YckC